MIRAGIYVRISKDSTGRAAGVRRQEKDCRELAADRGWDVGDRVFKDNDVSAYRKKPRPAWRELMAAVERGEVQAIVAWHPDRMYRRAADLEELVTFVESHRLKIATVTAGDVDLSTPTGRMQARIVGAVAQKESEQTGDRIRRALQERRARGLPAVGGVRSYGFRKIGEPGAVRLEVVPGEAAVLREAARLVIGGASWGSVAKDLNFRGVPTTKGGRWSPYLLRETILKPSVFGLQPDGTKGTWPAILSTRDRTMLERRVVRNGKDERLGARRYMLTGVVRCVACNAKMLGGGGFYRCSIIRGGCGKTAVRAHSLERVVLDEVNPLDEKRWRSERPRRTRAAEATLDKMEKLEQRLDSLAGNTALSERTLAVRERALQAELAKLREKLPVGDEEPPAPDPERTGELLQAWATGTLDQRGVHLLGGFLARRVAEVRVEPGRGNVPERTMVKLAH